MKIFKNYLKSRLFYIPITALILSLVLDPIISVNFINQDNWLLIIGVKCLCNLIVIITFIIACRKVTSKKIYSKKIHKLFDIFMFGLFSLFFLVGFIQTSADIIIGPQSYLGPCELKRRNTKYVDTLDIYLVNNNIYMKVKGSDYDRLTGYSISRISNNSYTCNSNVNVIFLASSGVVISLDAI